MHWATSLDIGCVRLSERFLTDDPPTAPSRSRPCASRRRRVAPDWRAARELIGVAGTITTLATIDLGLDEEVPELVDGHVLRPTRSTGSSRGWPPCRSPSGVSVRGLMPERAPTIVAGAAILAELMRAARARKLTVSERDILHGAALERGRAPVAPPQAPRSGAVTPVWTPVGDRYGYPEPGWRSW